MICVYPSDEKLFADNGLKILKPQKAVVFKADNDEYNLSIIDTIDNLDYYQAGMIIKVPTLWGDQCFRCSNPEVQNKKIIVKAEHLYFDTKNYVISDSYVVEKDLNDALDHLKSACETLPPFNLLSDISIINSYRCVRKSFFEAIADCIDKWGGHLVRDNFNIEIRSEIGEDRGVVLSHGKNITDIKSSEDWSAVATKILPVGKDGLTLPELYLSLNEELYDIPYTKVVQFEQEEVVEDDFKDTNGNLEEELYQQALINNLRAQGEAYLNENKHPKVNYTLSAYLKDVSDVGDTIYVKHPKCKIDITTNVISIEYDVIAEKITKIEFGNFKNKLKDLVSNITASATKKAQVLTDNAVVKMQQELQIATNVIKSMMNNSNVIYDGDKILVLDKLPKEEAKNVILINSGGIGFSSTGINGTFNSAWDITGTMNMQNINTINLVADMIKGGTLKLGSNVNEKGIIELYDESNTLICLVDKNGITLNCQNGDKVKLNAEDGFAGYDQQGNKIYWADGDEFHMKKSVVEEEITLAYRLRFVPMETSTNNGIALVPLIGGE